jgi:hypothetical protein
MFSHTICFLLLSMSVITSGLLCLHITVATCNEYSVMISSMHTLMLREMVIPAWRGEKLVWHNVRSMGA